MGFSNVLSAKIDSKEQRGRDVLDTAVIFLQVRPLRISSESGIT